MHRQLLIVGLLILPMTAPALAQAPEFLPVTEAIKRVADGKTWNGEGSGRPAAKITLNRDGTGTFEGPITMSISWERQGEDMCVNFKMAGTKCMRFRAIAGGYEGYITGKLDLKLTR